MPDFTRMAKTDIEAEYGVTIVGYRVELAPEDAGVARAESLSPDDPQQIVSQYETDGTEVRDLDPLIPLSEAVAACKNGDLGEHDRS